MFQKLKAITKEKQNFFVVTRSYWILHLGLLIPSSIYPDGQAMVF